MEHLTLCDLKNKRILSVRGINSSGQQSKRKQLPPEYILFDDRKTFMRIEEQDYYTFHDCDSSAKIIAIRQDKKEWNRIYSDKIFYPESKIRR